MKKLIYVLPFAGMVLASSCSQEGQSNNDVVLANSQDSVAYSLGLMVSESAGKPYFDTIDVDGVMNGVKAELIDGNATVDVQTAQMSIQGFMAQKQQNPDATAENLSEISYNLGVLLGANVKTPQFSDVNSELVMAAMRDQLVNNSTKISNDDSRKIISDFMAAQQAKQGELNIAEGQKFLEENGQKEGVVTTASGLQYEVMVEGGSGQKPTAADEVKVHYHGTLLDGTVFDSSVDRGEPISFPLSGVIPGWTEGVQLMDVGSKYRFFIPSDLAYGPRGAGGAIGPNATLIFEVELLGINEK